MSLAFLNSLLVFHLSAVLLRRIVIDNHWEKDADKPGAVSPKEKAFVRDNIVKGLEDPSNLVRTAVVSAMIHCDPESRQSTVCVNRVLPSPPLPSKTCLRNGPG